VAKPGEKREKGREDAGNAHQGASPARNACFLCGSGSDETVDRGENEQHAHQHEPVSRDASCDGLAQDPGNAYWHDVSGGREKS
jgi:hypothetical protein